MFNSNFFLQKLVMVSCTALIPLSSEAFNSRTASFTYFPYNLDTMHFIVVVFPIPGIPVIIKFGISLSEIILFIFFNKVSFNISSSVFFGLYFSIQGIWCNLLILCINKYNF